ncbi:hypothetical protein [Bradyrhizobium yuanmingense]|uniref:hypothetical protein n=1 Tax=Bradyrhizobium yuanmingense TaxID=108015 RepID=UPI000B1C38F6|nr:hypothetical protein [Bradyrhizobium yuanmingense]
MLATALNSNSPIVARMVRDRQIEPGDVARTSRQQWQRPLDPVAAALGRAYPNRAGTFHHRLEACRKPAGLGFIGVERRNAVRNDNQLHFGLLVDRIEPALHLTRNNSIGRTCTSLLLLLRRHLVQVLVKGRLACRFTLPRGG